MTQKTPKTLKHGVVNRVQNTLFRYQGWPSVARDEDGTLYAVASSFRCEHICPFGKAVISYSTDGGKTYTRPAPVIDTPLDDRDAGICTFGWGILFSDTSKSNASFKQSYFGSYGIILWCCSLECMV